MMSGVRPAVRSHKSPSVIMRSVPALKGVRLSSAAVTASSRALPSARRPRASSWWTIASPSAEICRSPSIPERPAIAAVKAEAVFSMMLLPSCRPRCATGRAVSHSIPGPASSCDLENPINFDGCVAGQHGDAHGRARVASFISEHSDHEIGCPIHDLRPLQKGGVRIDEAAQTNNARHPVKIADRGFDLGQHVDRAGARRFLALVRGNSSPKLTFRNGLAACIKADLSRNEQQGADTNEGNIVGDRSCRGGKGNSKLRKLSFNGSGHSPFLSM